MIQTDALLGKHVGAYKLTKVLGNQSSGAVFLAQQENSDRQAAIKLLPDPETSALSSSSWPSPLLQKMKLLAKLHHPYIISFYDYGEYSGLGYVVVPYVSGGSLRDVMQQSKQMDLSQTHTLVDQIAKAVDFAHEHTIIHGQLHAAQVLLQTPDAVLLSDFGWEPFSAHGAAMDIHALGKLLYEMVTGYPVEDPPIPPHIFSPDISDEIEQVLLSAIDLHATNYTQAQEVADAYSIALVETLHRRSSSFKDTSQQVSTAQAPLHQNAQYAGTSVQTKEKDITYPPSAQSTIETPEVAAPLATKTVSHEPSPLAEPFAPPTSIVSNPFMVVPLIFTALTVILLSAFGLLALRSTATNQAPSPVTTVTHSTNTTSVLVADDLAQNRQHWPVTAETFFANNAYHLLDHTRSPLAILLTAHPFDTPISYSITMQEIREDSSKSLSDENAFGIILCFQQHGTQQTFYSFEVLNKKNGEYRFWKYDSQNQGVQSSAWTLLWHQQFGSEFHYGLQTLNTITTITSDSTFTFIVNGTQVGSTPQYSPASGAIGLSVTRMGTEVAFSHLIVKQVKG